MNIKEIEQLPQVREAAHILHALETHGITEPAIAAGWTRSLLTDGPTNDIDVSYVGDIPYIGAQVILRQVLDEVNPGNKHMWDIEGIWNAQTAYGVTKTVDNFLLYYLNSIDSVYLASDGRLHDPTGYGFHDAAAKVLRINDYDLQDRVPTAYEEVNVCLENCRRLAKFNWTPTTRTIERITQGVLRWNELSEREVNYFRNKLASKYNHNERTLAQKTYDQYGWGFIFDI